MDSVGGHQLLLLLEVEGTNCTRRQTVICLRQYSREKDAFSLFFREYTRVLYIIVLIKKTEVIKLQARERCIQPSIRVNFNFVQVHDNC
jgi:hypothetical protein